MLNVILNETGEYSNVDSIMPIPNGIPAPTSKTAFFTWDMDQWDDSVFEKLPAWTQEQIKKSTQYQKDHAPVTTVEVKAPEVVQQAIPQSPAATAPFTQGSLSGGECPI
jgi:hypothetical protein